MISLVPSSLFWGCFRVKRLTSFLGIRGLKTSKVSPFGSGLLLKGLIQAGSRVPLAIASEPHGLLYVVTLGALTAVFKFGEIVSVGAEEESSWIVIQFQRGSAD